MKNWLAENQVFFETIAATLLSLMSIIVSINSCQQTEVQISLEKSIHQPSFTFTRDSIDPSQWNILNNSEPLYNFEIETVDMLDLTFYSESSKIPNSILVPLNYIQGESDRWIYGDKTIGKIALIYLDKNFDLNNLQTQFKDASSIFNGYEEDVDCDILTWINISYEDKFGEKKNKYFKYNSNFFPSSISEDNGREIFSLFFEKRNSMYTNPTFSKIDLMNLYYSLTKNERYFFQK